MMDDDEFIDYSIAQNKVMEEKNPELEIMDEFDRNLDEDEEE